jgi:hypothetical protein
MKRKYFIMLVLLVLFCPAFSRGQKSPSKARVEIINGVECIHNLGTPLHPDIKVTFVEDLSIGGEDKAGNVVLSEPWLSFVDNNENIYIFERRDQVIKVFGSDGKLIKTIGAKGSGPGEFQMIMNVAVNKNGKLLVFDSRSRRTSIFDSSGRFLESFQWRKRYYHFILIKDSSYIISALDFTGDGSTEQFSVKEVDFKGNETLIEGKYSKLEVNPIRLGNVSVYFSPPVSTFSTFAGDQAKEWFYHCLGDKYVLEVYNASGKMFRKIDRPYKPVRFTDDDAKAYRASIQAPNESFRKAIEKMEMPKEKSIVENMLVDDKSQLWIQTNEKIVEGELILTAFDVFDSEGIYIAKIWTPLIPRIFKKGKMYRMETDQDTGYKTLKRYKVIWK